jgi:hypothetical protein
VRIEILPEARDDLIAGFRFYERQAPGLGSYFRESILKDVDALAAHGAPERFILRDVQTTTTRVGREEWSDGDERHGR